MVAYSFAPQFVEAVSTLKKRQTVRGLRKRHARPGEPIQLYSGMRTKYCRKLVAPDPICIEVRRIEIENDGREVTFIAIDGVHLTQDEIEAFAAADGFGVHPRDGLAHYRMASFWRRHHGDQPFEGVVIRWEARD